MILICPCKDCKDRKAPKTCEKDCEKWNEWHNKHLQEKRENWLERYVNSTKDLMFERNHNKRRKK